MLFISHDSFQNSLHTFQNEMHEKVIIHGQLLLSRVI